MPRNKVRVHTEKQKKALLEKVSANISNGMSVREALKSAKLTPDCYYRWKKALLGETRIVVSSLPRKATTKRATHKPPNRVVAFVGTPEVVSRLVAEVGAL